MDDFAHLGNFKRVWCAIETQEVGKHPLKEHYFNLFEFHSLLLAHFKILRTFFVATLKRNYEQNIGKKFQLEGHTTDGIKYMDSYNAVTEILSLLTGADVQIQQLLNSR